MQATYANIDAKPETGSGNIIPTYGFRWDSKAPLTKGMRKGQQKAVWSNSWTSKAEAERIWLSKSGEGLDPTPITVKFIAGFVL